jgi:hypothetical protein
MNEETKSLARISDELWPSGWANKHLQGDVRCEKLPSQDRKKRGRKVTTSASGAELGGGGREAGHGRGSIKASWLGRRRMTQVRWVGQGEQGIRPERESEHRAEVAHA